MTRARFLRDERGVTAVEFALVAPVLIAMIVGVSQLGQLFFANSGIQHTVEQAARFAAIYPAPTIEEIEAKIHEAQVGMKGTLVPVLDEKEVDGKPVLDISLSYAVPLDFIVFDIPDVTLTHSRRVHLQRQSAPPAEGTTNSAGTSTGDTGTDTGDGGSNGGGNGNGGRNAT